jgi:hypothetical protein
MLSSMIGITKSLNAPIAVKTPEKTNFVGQAVVTLIPQQVAKNSVIHYKQQQTLCKS